ncbi:MAG: hypothetical protein Greene041619_146 [Candidatus Peregrinibacteria bacterium Greene0416_19]|nr:MAG: hypothetical protein Greene041619_146 [Candidatus Peregrinibacteria bacterium Greene0416_19]
MRGSESSSNERLKRHIAVKQYGKFTLTEAVRPSLDLQVIPQEGFRFDSYKDDRSRKEIPLLVAAVSREKLFDVFMRVTEEICRDAPLVDVVLETSHDSNGSAHMDLRSEEMDPVVARSKLWDFADILMDDGCTGIAVIPHISPVRELQFDEHKLLIVYGQRETLNQARKVLEDEGVAENPGLKVITDGEHLHSTSPEFNQRFREMCYAFGADVGWE